jgi:hypothetical protein
MRGHTPPAAGTGFGTRDATSNGDTKLQTENTQQREQRLISDLSVRRNKFKPIVSHDWRRNLEEAIL